MREFNFSKVSNQEKFEFRIDNSDNAFNFEEGKSFFKAFELPTQKAPYVITLRSFFIRGGHHYWREGYIYHPTVLLLDSSLETVAKLEAPAFNFGQVPWEPTGRGGSYDVHGEFEINPSIVRYLVIYTTANQLAGFTTTKVSQSTFAAGTALKFGDVYEIPHSPVGELQLEISTYK